MEQRKHVKWIPNLLTLLNMSLGLAAILLLIQMCHPFKLQIVIGLIVLGSLLDFLDGYLARRLNASTALGKQLDSFADVVTFGLAPIALVNYVFSQYDTVFAEYNIFFLISPSLIYMMAAAYRLARFNTGDFQDHFLGLPITVAGVSLAIYCLIYPLWSAHVPLLFRMLLTIAFILLLAGLMTSKKKVKRLVT